MSDKNTQGMGLQDIIDSYNRELMRIHSRTRTAPDGQAPSAAPVSAANNPPAQEKTTPAQARPQSSFSLENRAGAAKHAALKTEPAGSPAADNVSTSAASSAMNGGEWDLWLKELETGLEELRKGMIELAKGQKELSDGLREWQEGVTGTKYTGEGWSVPYNGRYDTQYNDRENAPQNGENMSYKQENISAASTVNSPASGDNPHEAAHNMPVPDEPPLNPPLDDIPAQPLGYGILCVAVNTARQAMPIKGASVTVTLPVGDRELLYSFTSTDDSGRSPDIELPVYSADDAVNAPVSDGYTEYIPRYRTYRVRVQAAGFRMQDDLMAEIFDGLSSTLTAELEPLPGNNNGNNDIGGNSSNGGGEGM